MIDDPEPTKARKPEQDEGELEAVQEEAAHEREDEGGYQ